MSKSNFPIPPQTVGLITGVLLVSSIILSFWARSDGPDWAWRLGLTFLGCLFLIPGVLFLLDPQLSISWFRAMKPRRRDGYSTEPLLWLRLQTGERILVAIGIYTVSGFGLVILFNTVPNLLRDWGIL
jgi:MFS family permease